MGNLTKRKGAIAAVAAAALLIPGVGANAAPEAMASPVKDLLGQRKVLSFDDLKFQPAALSPDRKVQVLIEFESKSVVERAAALRAAGKQVDLAAVREAVRNSQSSPLAAVKAAGVTVSQRYVETVSAIAGTVKYAAFPKLAAIAGVKSIDRVQQYLPDNNNSNLATGASTAWTAYGATGQGVTIAIIDTGIDYGHSDFGGVGTVAAYEENDPTWLERGVQFPTDKVIGGYDFVGNAYGSGENPARPDPDPLDCNGHGTHVAGTAAGFGVNSDGSTYTGEYSQEAVDAADLHIAPGAAPQAKLLAYKVFGCDGGTGSDIIVAAINRAVADGADVINMSLGSSYGRPTGVEQTAIRNAVAAGVVVVISAGNAGHAPYLVGGASTAPAAISVAASDGTAQFPGASLTSGDTTITAQNSNGAALPGGSATIEVVGDGNGGIALGCSPEDYEGMAGKIVVVKRGDCARVDRVIYGQAAGAAAVIMVNNSAGYPYYEGEIPGVTIPFLGLRGEDSAAILALDGASASLAATTIPNPAFGSPASFTSAGPRSGDAGVKPDLIAPGVSVISAAVGSGYDYANYSGTSMAAPHTSGVAALVRQVQPKWTAQQIKNALVNTASNDVARLNPDFANYIVGNGLVDPLAAVRAKVVMQSTTAGDVGLTFGVTETPSVTKKAKIFITNVSGKQVTVNLSTMVDREGVTLSVKPTSFKLLTSRWVDVSLTMTKTAVNNQAIGLTSALDVVRGEIHADVVGAPTSRLPVQLVPYTRSQMSTTLHYSDSGAELRTRNTSSTVGGWDLYEWIGGDSVDPYADLDFRALGAQSFRDGGDRYVVLAVNMHRKFNNPADTEMDIYVDVTGDGNWDSLVITADLGLIMDGYANGQPGVLVLNYLNETAYAYPVWAPLDGSTMYVPFYSSDVSVTNSSRVIRFIGVDTYALYGDGWEDWTWLGGSYNPYNPVRSMGIYGEWGGGGQEVVPVGWRELSENDYGSLGWMVSYWNNRTNKQADLLWAPVWWD